MSVMANDCDWHKFYFKKWSGDEAVKLMNPEQVGCYWLLLVHQMENGDLPADTEELALILHHMDPEHFRAKVWSRIMGKFKPVLNKEGRLHNEHLTRVMEDDKARRGKFSDAGKRGYAVRSMESALAEVRGPEAAVEELPDINITPILKAYPKRANNVGFGFGEAMIRATVSSQEDFNAVYAAVKNYAKENRTCPRDKIKRLDNFMREWRDWLPKGYVESAAPVEASPTPTAGFTQPTAPAVPEKRIPKSWCVPEGLKLARALDKAPPWVVNDLDFAAKMEANRLFPTEASKHQWWTTAESTETSAGA